MTLAELRRWVVEHHLLTGALLAVIALGIWAFLTLAEVVFAGQATAFDEAVLLRMRTPGDLTDPVGPKWFEEMARDMTALGGVLVLALLTTAMATYLWLAKRRWIAVYVVAAVVSGTLVSTAMKSAFDRARPELVPHESIVLTQSFPSGHTSMSSLVYLTAAAVVARAESKRAVRALVLGLAVAILVGVGLSRVYLGVHWPTDVLAGWAFGISWAAGSWVVLRLLERRPRFGPPPATVDVPRAPQATERPPS